MSSLREIDRRPLERLLGMGGGFVLDFTDRTFGEFFQDEASVDIHSARYTLHGSSKANKLRAFWRVESDSLVGKTLMALIDCSIESEPLQFGPELNFPSFSN